MERHGDPDYVYDMPEEKRTRAVAYLLAKAQRDGRLTFPDPEAESGKLTGLFGAGAGG